MSEDAWSTIRVALIRADADASERLDALGGTLAMRDDVGGVETRDPSLFVEGPEFVSVERAELIVYTVPTRRDAVEAAAREGAAMLGLEVCVEVDDHRGDDWRDAWKRHYRAMRFIAGERALLLRPSWIPRGEDDPELELVLDPGRAFGTGLHESTRLCLQALVELAEAGLAPARVLDLGCGSGILGLAARVLWPGLESLVLADHDPEAVATARENVANNGLADAPGVELRVLALGPEVALEPAQLCLANIRPEVLIPAAATLIAATAPGGTLVLSGILDEEGDEVLAAYAGLELRARPREGDWCALILRRASA